MLLEEPLHAGWREHHKYPGGVITDVLKAVRRAAGDEDKGALIGPEQFVVGDEAELPIEHVPHLVFALVAVKRRAFLWSDRDLQQGKGTPGGLGAGLHGGRTAGRTPDRLARAILDHKRSQKCRHEHASQ